MAAISLSYTIDSADAAEALTSFLAIFPNITSFPDHWTNDPLTNEEWMDYKVKSWVDSIIDQGRRKVDLRDNYTPPVTKSFVR